MDIYNSGKQKGFTSRAWEGLAPLPGHSAHSAIHGWEGDIGLTVEALNHKGTRG